MFLRVAVLVSMLLSCAREEPHATATSAVPVTSASVVAPPRAKKCLPVVAPDCGCVYSCGVGTETSPGTWSVVHPNWAPSALQAKVAPWCVSGDCTDAFRASLPCDIVCAPKPADHTCHFEGDRCVGR